MEEGFAVFMVLMLFGVCVTIYFVPLIVAKQRHHPQIVAIGVVNFFAGWTLIGWVGALAWACTVPQPPLPVPPPLFPRTPRLVRRPVGRV